MGNFIWYFRPRMKLCVSGKLPTQMILLHRSNRLCWHHLCWVSMLVWIQNSHASIASREFYKIGFFPKLCFASSNAWKTYVRAWVDSRQVVILHFKFLHPTKERRKDNRNLSRRKKKSAYDRVTIWFIQMIWNWHVCCSDRELSFVGCWGCIHTLR